jgi:aspartyl-tRNA(Asn)/glutamyl-tRNA(Gln) amidotransferase subunit A
MTPGDVLYASIGTVRELLERRELSASELTRLQLDRVRSIAGLNAFISVLEESALEEARRCDDLTKAGEALAPLHGIPITAKDIVRSKGQRTTSGSRIDAQFVPERDAPALARLRDAGAVLLGKTNLHEFAFGVSNMNPHYGAARNPWDESRISGGSSGGSAVALAAGVGYGSIGTDTGGSIRIPSSLCGVVGLKPTYGAISREGVTPLSWSLDHVGPMARRVEDVALLFEVMAGRKMDIRPVAGSLPLRGVKVGLHERHFFENLSAEVGELVRNAIAEMEQMGAEVIELEIPEIEIQSACRNTIAFSEASSYHEENIKTRPEEYGEDTRELLRLGLLIPASDYLAALRARRPIVRAFRKAFESIDVLVAPATPAPAPPIGASHLENGEELRAGLIRLVGPFNTVGFPAIALPCGLTRDRLPIGLQLASSPSNEANLLRAALAYQESQSATDWSRRRPAV